MDRKKEESETLIKSESTTPTTNTTTTATTTSTTLNTPNDDDTSSESFETWTIINDKGKSSFHDKNVNRVEILKNNDDDEEKSEEYVEEAKEEDVDHDLENGADQEIRHSSMDDVSDGVSVISESDIPHEESQIRRRRQSGIDHLQFSFLPDNFVKPLPPVPTPVGQQLQEATKSLIKYSYSMTKHGVKCALYVGFGLAILGLLGNFHNYIWFTSVTNPLTNTDKLQEKVDKLQIQNDKMRAEINSLQDKVSVLLMTQKPNSLNWREDKKFKAWSGNGDCLKPVDITKEDLRKPFKCPDGSFVEIANMCIEKQPANDPSILDQFGQVVENLNEESHRFVDKNNNESKNNIKESSHEWKKEKFDSRATGYNNQRKRKNADSRENKGDWMENHMKNREQLRKRYKSIEDDDDSGEWPFDYLKEKEMRRNKNGYKEDSGEWHHNYMKHREKQRKQTEEKTKYYKNVKNN